MTQRVSLVKAESPGSPEIPLNVDSSGNIGVNVESGGSGGGSGGVVQVSDGTTKTQLLAVDANGKIGVNALPAITGATTNAVLTAVEDQTTHYLATKDLTLNTLVGVGSTVPISGSVTATLSSMAFTNTILTAVEDQTTHYLATKDVGKVPITGTLQNAATGTGVGTPLTISGMKMVAIQVTSTVVGSITYDFEVSVDGTNFMTGIDAVDMLGVDNIGSISQTGAGTWIYQIMCAGIAKIQCNITANGATGGTSVTVTAQAVA